MKTTTNQVFEKIFQLYPAIRSIGVYSNNDFQYSLRKGITPYLDENKTIKSFKLSVKKYEEQEQLLSSEIGNPIYSITMYEIVKQITMKLKDGTFLLFSTELEMDHEKLLIDLMDYSDSLSNTLS